MLCTIAIVFIFTCRFLIALRNMNIKDIQLESFRNLYKSHFWKEIDEKTALNELNSLLNLVKLLLSNSQKIWK